MKVICLGFAGKKRAINIFVKLKSLQLKECINIYIIFIIQQPEDFKDCCNDGMNKFEAME